ncbi:MAG: T9SS type A sorting domain-containing protein [Bacteroidota bacterium]
MKHFLPVFFLFLVTSFSIAQSNTWNSTPSQRSSRTVLENNPIQVFPNPATSYIGITEVKGVEKVLIFNLVGRKMKQFENIAKDRQYFIGDLPKGMYLVQLLDQQNKVITTRRVSKR